MEAALAPWFQRYDTMMVVLSPFHCFCQKYPDIRNSLLTPGYWFIKPTRHQPKKSPSNSVGARVVEWGREGLYGRPRPVPCAHLWGDALTPPAPGDHQGPLHIHPTTLSPTDHPASCLSSRLRLMPRGYRFIGPTPPFLTLARLQQFHTPLQKSVIIRNITHARANAFSVET